MRPREGREKCPAALNVTTPRTRRNRRRLAAWLGFAAVGIATGAVWATGFASIGGATGTDAASPIVAPSEPGDQAADLAGAVTPGSALTVNWDGRWGSNADTNFFTVDLSAKPNTRDVQHRDVLLTNDISNAGWSSLQLKVEAVDRATGACVAADFDGTNRPEVMAFDAQDAGVYWNGLPGGDIYCIGVNASDGQDSAGTFLRRADEADTTRALPDVRRDRGPRLVSTVRPRGRAPGARPAAPGSTWKRPPRHLEETTHRARHRPAGRARRCCSSRWRCSARDSATCAPGRRSRR